MRRIGCIRPDRSCKTLSPTFRIFGRILYFCHFQVPISHWFVPTTGSMFPFWHVLFPFFVTTQQSLHCKRRWKSENLPYCFSCFYFFKTLAMSRNYLFSLSTDIDIAQRRIVFTLKKFILFKKKRDPPTNGRSPCKPLVFNRKKTKKYPTYIADREAVVSLFLSHISLQLFSS